MIIESTVVALPMKDIDTDAILPAQYLTNTSKTGFGANLFERFRAGDPAFPLNEPSASGCTIFLTESNFGCGSSREHAVWALQGWGVKALVGKSFADIFSSNAGKNGLLLVTLPEKVIDELFAVAGSGRLWLKIDLAAQSVQLEDGSSFRFEFDAFRKHCLMNGIDELDYLRSYEKEIRAHAVRRQSSQRTPRTSSFFPRSQT